MQLDHWCVGRQSTGVWDISARGCCEWPCWEHLCAGFCGDLGFQFSWAYIYFLAMSIDLLVKLGF